MGTYFLDNPSFAADVDSWPVNKTGGQRGIARAYAAPPSEGTNWHIKKIQAHRMCSDMGYHRNGVLDSGV